MSAPPRGGLYARDRDWWVPQHPEHWMHTVRGIVTQAPGGSWNTRPQDLDEPVTWVGK